MQYRRLGRTELKVSCIGLGGMGVISQNHPDRTSAHKIIHTALERGVNFIDTARSYFDSEEIIGDSLEGRSEQVYLATKTYQRSAKRAEKEIETCFEKLKVKKIHLFQLHHVQYIEEFQQAAAPGGTIELLKSLQKQGLIDHIGVSSHNPAILPQLLETDIFDTAQFPFSVVERDHFKKVEEIVKRRDIGTIIMKPLAGGNITSVEAALLFLLSHDVSTVIPGCSTVEQVIMDTEAGINFRELTTEEKQQIIKDTENLPDQFCRRCRYCEKVCSKNLPISDIFRCEDYLILSATYARDQYKSLGKSAALCSGCGQCEKICPYHLPVREKLKKAHKRLSKGKIEDFAVRILRKTGLYDIARKLYFELGGKIPER
ncbi:MAG: aldo/keto reductase [Firmicutes bacterium]|nr:aldo/keto reductase [Bacillota bacterium]